MGSIAIAGSGGSSGRTILAIDTSRFTIQLVGTIATGSGYVAGTYSNVPLTGGSSSGAKATIRVGATGGVEFVIALEAANSTNYAIGDVLSASNTNLGGSGTGFTFTVNQFSVAFFVTTGGSDSNNGLTSGTSWATLQHAVNVLAEQYDIGGFTATVNCGSGTFAGFGLRSFVGGGIVMVEGLGPSNTIWTAGPNDGELNTGECVTAFFSLGTSFYWDQVTLRGQASGHGSGYVVILDGPNFFGMGQVVSGGNVDVDLVNSPLAVFGNFTGGGFFIPGVTGRIIANGGSTFNFWDNEETGVIKDFCNFTCVGTPVWSQSFYFGSGGSSYLGILSNAVYSGASTGPRVILQFGASCGGTGNLGPTFFPGNSFGTIDSSSDYDGIHGENVNYQQPITGFTITLNNTDTQLIIDPAGTLAAGTVKMPAAPIDAQNIIIRTSQIITSLTINGNGATVAGYATGTLALGGILNAIYKSSNTTWYF